jgi:hypothetical protein
MARAASMLVARHLKTIAEFYGVEAEPADAEFD